ncbi:hypothetical protein [Natranaerofaba carboxydovora]|uniref:hypothetical protein n=1 Tax=Natranaerofaba carboxydovora TaxID=2742683 RepID=UPI001F141849|nr:hypothetical protein [Natranaerofaba carboxydovora]UMZ74204.1 hypothetical protein ACONDI_01785 [Natranaerofaba carboxydovora]
MSRLIYYYSGKVKDLKSNLEGVMCRKVINLNQYKLMKSNNQKSFKNKESNQIPFRPKYK